MDKEQIIKELKSMHPSHGVEHGLSEYTGGMKDTGYWFIDKLESIDEKSIRGIYFDIKTPVKDERPMFYPEENKKARDNGVTKFNNGKAWVRNSEIGEIEIMERQGNEVLFFGWEYAMQVEGRKKFAEANKLYNKKRKGRRYKFVNGQG